MISRRNFFSITIMMFAVFLLCMSLTSWKDGWNDYSVNRYTETAENYPSQFNIYIPGSPSASSDENAASAAPGETLAARDTVIYIGGAEGAPAVEQWVTYTKRKIAQYPTVAAFSGYAGEAPELLVLDPAGVNWGSFRELELLMQCIEEGTHLVFCALPEVSVIKGSEQVRELLGIQGVRKDRVSLNGYYLRPGFLLGGEAFYLETLPASEEPLPGSAAFPGERQAPWYLPASGTKLYMRGIPEGTEMDAEDNPILLWRKSFGTAYVFAAAGGLMEGQAVLGLLSAISAEIYPYELYPVVNAQNIILEGYPSLADENGEALDPIYSRPLTMVLQELVWPGIVDILERDSYRATCMITPQYDYTDPALPNEKQLAYYLKLFNEQAAETGFFAFSPNGAPLSQKLQEDADFFRRALGGYDFISLSAGNLTDGELESVLDSAFLPSVRTVVQRGSGTAAPIEALSEEVTAQRTIDDGLKYTYESDFLVRSIETALGYFSMHVDLSRLAYPAGEEDHLEAILSALSITSTTYGQQFPDFDRTTAAECDARIRQLLALDFEDSRTDDTIHVQLENVTGPVWFILRTHNESIRELTGGSWKKLEDGAYLIEAQANELILTLGPVDQQFYH